MAKTEGSFLSAFTISFHSLVYRKIKYFYVKQNNAYRILREEIAATELMCLIFTHQNKRIHGKYSAKCQLFTDDDDDLSVVHISDDGEVEILEPLEVTQTHVVVNVSHLSWFGLIKKRKPKSKAKPTHSQLLLLLRQPSNRRELKVCLVPANVPIDRVNIMSIS